MYDSSSRCLIPELMDQPEAPIHEVHKALKELEMVNRYLGGYEVVLDALQKYGSKSLSLMDIGCGGGDMLRQIAVYGRKNGIKTSLTGVDMNPSTIQYAREQSAAYQEINYIIKDCRELFLVPGSKPDVVMSSLFCHHFDNDELVELIKKKCSLAGKMVLINDLHRHWLAYYSIRAITAVFSRTYLVKNDAPLSVARSLKFKEWEKILNMAGVKKYQINWKWAWRWQILIEI
jgi:2-polyprenyl-3-methyl-5-hydroxy-6-metoxy-1,4-benzoquinol methylase